MQQSSVELSQRQCAMAGHITCVLDLYRTTCWARVCCRNAAETGEWRFRAGLDAGDGACVGDSWLADVASAFVRASGCSCMSARMASGLLVTKRGESPAWITHFLASRQD